MRVTLESPHGEHFISMTNSLFWRILSSLTPSIFVGAILICRRWGRSIHYWIDDLIRGGGVCLLDGQSGIAVNINLMLLHEVGGLRWRGRLLTQPSSQMVGRPVGALYIFHILQLVSVVVVLLSLVFTRLKKWLFTPILSTNSLHTARSLLLNFEIACSSSGCF